MNISVGYRIDKMERVKRDGEDYYKANWTPMEVSSVSVPADQSRLVGVGRSKDKQTKTQIKHIIQNGQVTIFHFLGDFGKNKLCMGFNFIKMFG